MHPLRNTVGKYPFLPVQRHDVVTRYRQRDLRPQHWSGMIETLRNQHLPSLVELLQHDLGNGGALEDPQLRIFRSTDFAALGSNGNGALGYEILDEEKKGQVIDGIRQDTAKRTGALSKKVNVSGMESAGAASVGRILLPHRVEELYLSSTPQLLHALLAEDRRGQMSRRTNEKKNAYGLFRDIIDSGMIQRIHADDLHELLHLCFSLTSTNPGTVECTLALGATESEPTLRLPSYALSSIDLMRVLLKHKNAGAFPVMPQLRVYFGTSLGYSVNTINREKAQLCEKNMEAVLRHFIETYAPDIAPYVRMENDSQVQHISAETAQERFTLVDERFADINRMRRDIEESLTEDAPGTGSLYEQVIHQAVRMMNKQLLMTAQSAPLDVMRYSASHPDFFGDIVEHPAGKRSPDFIVSIGGKGEEYFNNCRRAIVGVLQQRRQDAYYPHAIRIVQQAGKDPPYYNHDGIDPFIGETHTGPKFTSETASASRKSITSDYDSLRAFLRTYLAEKNRIPLQQVTEEMTNAELQQFSLSAANRVSFPSSYVSSQ